VRQQTIVDRVVAEAVETARVVDGAAAARRVLSQMVMTARAVVDHDAKAAAVVGAPPDP